MMVVYRITIPLLAMFGIVGNLLNVVILRFLSKMIVLVNVNLFHPSQHQFKDSVYFFLKVASPITFSWSIVFSMILAAWLILRKSLIYTDDTVLLLVNDYDNKTLVNNFPSRV